MLGHEIKILANIIGKEMDRGLKSIDKTMLTTTHMSVIHYLYLNRNRSVYQRDIETDFEIARSTVTNILQPMEKKGLLLRIADTQDARLKRLELTEKGLDIHSKNSDFVFAFEAKLIDGISPDELAGFMKTLHKIKANAEK